MTMLYKKCRICGQINKYMEGEYEPEICSKPGCNAPLDTEEFVYKEGVEYEDSIEKKETCFNVIGGLTENTPLSKTRFSFVIQNRDVCIAIPDDMSDEKIVLGRQGLGSKERIWGDNISRKHLSIEVKAGGIFVEDMGSTNGTIVNGKKLNEHVRTFLTEGSTIVLDAIKQDYVLKLERTK